MKEDTERTLLALTNLIIWEGSLDGGCWYGKTVQEPYRYFTLYAPQEPGGADVIPFQQWWQLRTGLSSGNFRAPFLTLAQAKAACARYVLTGSGAELQARHAIADAEEQTFYETKRTASAQIGRCLRQRKVPPLTFGSGSNDGLEFAATAPGGTYQVRFELSRRWVVTFTGAEPAVEEQCFVTRVIARKACSIHAATGQWHGALWGGQMPGRKSL